MLKYLPVSAAADDAPVWPQLATIKNVYTVQQGIGLRVDVFVANRTGGHILAETEGCEPLRSVDSLMRMRSCKLHISALCFQGSRYNATCMQRFCMC